MPNVTMADCKEERKGIYALISSRVPRWLFLIAGGLVLSAFTGIGGWVLANANGITVLTVESAHIREGLARLEVRQEKQEELLRSIDKRVNGD